MKSGWIKSYRKMTEHWIWKYKEPYDRRSAWQYILLEAYFCDSTIAHKGEIIHVERGQFPTSIRDLAERWMWSKGKVQRFLSELETERMIELKRTKNGTLLTVVNYGFYQGCKDSDGTLIETPAGTPTGHSRDTDGYTHGTLAGHNIRNKEYKEDKELKKERRGEYILTVSNETVCHADIQQIVEKWNTLSEYGIKPISRLHSDSKRYKCLASRLNEYGKEEVVRAIENIKKSNFLQGKESGSSWVITFDWFVLPSNFPKVLDGNYENRQATKKKRIVDNNNFERRKYDMSDLEKKLLINKNN